MQKIATRIFIYASVAFGVIGVCVILTSPNGNEPNSDLNLALLKLLFICVFFILPSFALSVAGKFLVTKK